MRSKNFDRIPQLESHIDPLLPRDVRASKSDELLDLVSEYAALVSDQAGSEGPLFPAAADQTRGLALAQRPVFICGVPRSGTTLMQGLLNGHESLCSLPSEGSFLTSLRPRLRAMEAREALAWLTREWVARLININSGPHWVLGRSSRGSHPYAIFARTLLGWESLMKQNAATGGSCHLHTAVVLAFWSVHDEHKGATQWVDKTPTNEFHAAELAQNYPKARFIHMMRDPRAVVASRLRLQRTLGLGDRNLRQLLVEIRRSLTLALRNRSTLGHACYLWVHYERLVASPEPVMRQVAEFLQLDYTTAMCHPVAHGDVAVANTSFEGDRTGEDAVYQSSENLFESYLSAKELQLISASLADVAHRCQYSLEPAPLYRRLEFFSTKVAVAAVRTVKRLATKSW